ncbi:transcription initiation factor IIE subunit alpha-like [Rosa rugosa]|uniref:transcription initiation factor IIE subunit alpha-like n=1 Tax=Rosa rugosa TaxID=74645 RepID=UPI002B40216D|nr:transcription initiation factor IIE subunit alpha-like [Rosa rugosa]
MTSIEPFNRLVKLAARALYDDDIATYSSKGANSQLKSGRSVENRGIGVVVLEALSRRQWVREEDLAKDLKLNSKQLRRTLQFFEEEKLVTRDHRKERHAKKEGEEKIKLHTYSYCCLDYAQMYDVVRYRLHRMKKRLKDALEDKNTVQQYLCHNCGNRYNALDALRLISMEDDEYFHCERCNGKLVVVETNNELASPQVGDEESNISRRQRREKSKVMLRNMEEQLKPLMEQINRVKDLPVPQFGTLRDWEARAKSSDGHDFGGTKVEVEVTWVKEDKGDDIKSELDDPTTSLGKIVPPWMNKQGMNNLPNHEQHGHFSDDIKANTHEDNESKSTLQEEYYKAYYRALIQRQQEEEANIREVGMKSKCDRKEGEDEDDIDWQEG